MDDVVKILKETGAVLEGHFIGTSGRHLHGYMNKDKFLPHAKIVSEFSRMFAELNKDKNIEVVVSPAVAGIPFSQWTSYHLSLITGKEVLGLFTEKTPENGQIFKRGYDQLVKGKRVLVVEDTVATGGSVKKVIDTVRAAGGEVVQVSILVNRDPDNVNEKTFGCPLNSLAVIPMPSFAEDEVPDWLKAMPIRTDVGHGAKYLQEHPQNI
ncbi:phosphoribosyltransferase [Patescibacteria group bacterium]|nr:phosphoribosyltransferase [Patescibacteria group bacterium]